MMQWSRQGSNTPEAAARSRATETELIRKGAGQDGANWWSVLVCLASQCRNTVPWALRSLHEQMAPESEHSHDHHLHGVAHRHSDVYTTENPVPSIQRFLSKGIGRVVDRRGRHSDEDEYETSDSSSDEDAQDKGSKGQHTSKPSRKRASKRLSGLLGRSNKDSEPSEKDHDLPQASTDGSDGKQVSDQTPEERSKAAARGSEVRHRRRGEATTIIDPVTQQTVSVRDVRRKDYERAMKREELRTEGKEIPSHPDAPVNVANCAFPPQQPIARLSDVHPLLIPLWATWTVALLCFCRSLLAIPFVLGNAWIGWWAFRHTTITLEDKRWERERLRGETARSGTMGDYDHGEKSAADAAASGHKEGAEWLNSLVERLWEVIDPAIFDSVAGTLEDVMQASAPAFIHMIKVSAVAHGTTPLRVAGVRILPDQEADYVTPKQPENGKKDDESRTFSGTHINLEMALIYHAAKTGQSLSSRSKNARLEMQFFLGLRKVVTFPLPIWVEIKGFVGTVRARLQLTPEAPFIKNLTFTFLGLPRVQVEVVPLHVNLSNIPILSGFVQSSIDAAMAEYCAPSSLTLDVGEILMGDKIKRDVSALGVIVIWIHSAYDLEQADSNGSSDPYVTVAMSHGKVSYATRVALKDLNPRWEERHVMLLNPESIRAKEKLSLALWDSDRFTPDDILGRVEFDLGPLVRHPGRIFRRSDSLMGISNELSKKGKLKWSVAFFKKVSNRYMDGKPSGQADEEQHGAESPAAHGAESPAAHEGNGQEAQTQPKEQAEKDEDKDTDDEEQDDVPHDDPLASVEEDTSTQALLQMLDAAETATQTRNQKNALVQRPPDPKLHTSGILSIQVHNISDLTYRNEGRQKQSLAEAARPSGKVGSAAQQVNDVQDESDDPDAPSPYVNIVLNDQTVMVSRVKALTSTPFFQIGVERFIRDWKRSFVMIVVRDRRLREADPILGVVPLNLRQLFEEHQTSQITQYFPLAGGLGHGRARISVLFRPIEGMHLDKSKLGFDVGTMRIHSSPRAVDLTDSSSLRLASIRMRTLVGQIKITSRHSRSIRGDKGESDHSRDDSQSSSQSQDRGIEWHVPSKRLFLRCPVRRRYSAPFVFEFRKPNALGVKSVVAASVIWMQDVEDDAPFDASLPIYRGKPSLHRLLQDYHCHLTEQDDVPERMGVERIGTLKVRLQFKSGMGKIHAKLDHNPDSKAVMEAWEACVAAGLRSATGDFADDKDLEQEDPVEHAETASEGESEPETAGAKDRKGADSDQSDGDEATHDDDDDDDDEADEEEGSHAKSGSRTRKQDESKWRQWRREARELHRQQRGIKSHKPVRSVEWLWDSAKAGSSQLKRKLTVQERSADQVDSEI
ncbi:unnamed protein product [Parajaminaea phylloscopi]